MPEWLRRLTKSDIRSTITLVVLFGCFSVLFALIFKPIPQQNHDLVSNMISFITGSAFGAIVGFYFSASKPDKHNINEKDN